MVNINRTILRSLLVISYVAVMLAVIYGISAVMSYLNTGADRSKMLHTEVKKVEVYAPQVSWESTNNEGRPVSKEMLNAIKNDYLNAWYVKQVAYKTNIRNGIEDYYTKHSREEVYQFIENQSSQNTNVESTTLQHHLSLEFLSEDGQLAVLTDKDVVEYKRFLIDGKLSFETSEQSTYKVILLLEDGFWRIRHMVKQDSKTYDHQKGDQQLTKLNIKGINYYPQDSPWDTFGDQFSTDTLSRDFKIIKEAGLNSIRIFIQYEDFGKAEVRSDKLQKLQQLLNVAHQQDLKVVMTLFDFYGDYSMLNWTLDQKHAVIIANHIKDHPALLAWDIKNEPDLDFDSRGKPLVLSWLRAMTDLIKSIDENHPITIGWSNPESATLLSDQVDMVSFHYYKPLEDLEQDVIKLKQAVPDKLLVMQEFGQSSYSGLWKPFGGSGEDQAQYHKKAQQIIAKQDLQFMSWTLYDFQDVPNAVTGWQPWRKKPQKAFGFIDKHGKKKPSFEYMSLE